MDERLEIQDKCVMCGKQSQMRWSVGWCKNCNYTFSTASPFDRSESSYYPIPFEDLGFDNSID